MSSCSKREDFTKAFCREFGPHGFEDFAEALFKLRQNRMKTQADKHRSEREFQVGDSVYLRLVPYRMKSLADHSYHKLLPKFYGPYEIMERLGPVVYKLKLPTGCKIHPVFHVSCLKKHLGAHVIPSLSLPRITEDGIV